MKIQQRINALEARLRRGQGGSIEERLQACMEQHNLTTMSVVVAFMSAEGDKDRFCRYMPEDVRTYLWDTISKVEAGCKARQT